MPQMDIATIVFRELSTKFRQKRQTKSKMTITDKILGLNGDQGDKIGRIFAYWAFVFSGQFFLNFRISPNCLGIFLPRKIFCITFDKKGIGVHFWRFFTSSSGHPDGD
jgi:hypothetical protein